MCLFVFPSKSVTDYIFNVKRLYCGVAKVTDQQAIEQIALEHT